MPSHSMSGKPRRPRRSRLRRALKITAFAVLLTLAAATVARIVAPEPQVGRWRSAQGRQAYLTEYNRAMKLLPTPSLTKDVATSYGTVRAYGWTSPEHAEKTPVVLLPGISSGTPQWSEQVEELAAQRDVYTFDALGDTGLSAQTVPLPSYDDQAVWIEETLAGLDLDRVHMVGHSFGAASGIVHTQHHPERVSSLTLLEPAFTLAYPPPAIFVWATVAILPVPASWRDKALAEIGGTTVEEVRSDDPVGRMITAGAEHFSNSLPTPSPRDDATLAAITVPVYVAIAERSSLAGGQKAADRVHLMPNSTVETWPGTTHSLPFQTGPALTQRLAKWWDGLGG